MDLMGKYSTLYKTLPKISGMVIFFFSQGFIPPDKALFFFNKKNYIFVIIGCGYSLEMPRWIFFLIFPENKF